MQDLLYIKLVRTSQNRIMHKFRETKIVPCDIQNIYELVLDVEKYPEFLPWIEEVLIIEKTDSSMLADMLVNFSGIKRVYRSEVTFNIDENNATIEVKALKGIFNHLYNIWNFTRDEKNTIIEFDIDFEFSSKMFDSIAAPIFEMISEKMISSFEKRAKEKYEHK